MRKLIAIMIATLAGVAVSASVDAGGPASMPVVTASAFDLDSIPLKQPACDKFAHCGRRHGYGHRGYGRSYYGGGYGYGGRFGGGYYPSYHSYRPVYYGGGYAPIYNAYRPTCGGGYGGYGGYGYGGSVNIRF